MSSIEYHGSSDPDWWIDPHLRHHLSAAAQSSIGFLCLNVETVSTGETQPLIYSGFFLCHRDRYFWVTAGHVLRSIKQLLEDDRFRVKEVRMRDGRPLDDENASSLPMRLDVRYMFEVDHDSADFGESAGFDFGMYRLPRFELAGLLCNEGMDFFDASDSIPFDSQKIFGAYLIGAPGEHVEYATPNDVRARIYFLPLRLSTDLPPALRPPLPRAIYGQLVTIPGDPYPVNSIAGMSGGAVISVEEREDGKIGYRLIGIQSAWLASTRHVRITSLSDVLRGLEAVIPADGQDERRTSS